MIEEKYLENLRLSLRQFTEMGKRKNYGWDIFIFEWGDSPYRPVHYRWGITGMKKNISKFSVIRTFSQLIFAKGN